MSPTDPSKLVTVMVIKSVSPGARVAGGFGVFATVGRKVSGIKSVSAVELTVAASMLDTSKGSFTYGLALAGPDTVTEYEHSVLAGKVPLTT